MNVEKGLARLFGLEGDEWLRHANPKSVYSRFPLLPLLIVAAWSRVWIGIYFLIPLGLTILWTILNPRLFDTPDSFDSWASKGVLGERVWKDRDQFDIPGGFALLTHALNATQVVGMLPFIWGLYTLNFWMTMTGFAVAFLCKAWFFDRMAWLFEEMRERDEVRSWLN